MNRKKIAAVSLAAALLMSTAVSAAFAGGDAVVGEKTLNVTVEASSSSIELSFIPVQGIDEYDIYRSEFADGPYVKIGNAQNGKYTDTTAGAGATYYYQVRSDAAKLASDVTANKLPTGAGQAAKCDIGTQMYTLNEGENTWVFAGGAAVEGRYSEIGGARSYIGQFEEFIRSSIVTRDPKTRQRYTFNAGRSGQTMTDVNEQYDRLVREFDPRAISVLVGVEDCQKGQAGVAACKEALRSLVDKTASLRGGKGYLVIQTPYAQKDKVMDENARLYTQAINELYQSLDAAQKARVCVVDHYTQTNNNTFKEQYLTKDGYPNEHGQLELAIQLTRGVCSNNKQFPINHAKLNQKQIWLESPLDSQPQPDLTPLQQEIRQIVDSEEPATWLFIGDSITHGALLTQGYDSIHQSFEKFILQDLGRKQDLIINTGVCNSDSRQQQEYTHDRLDKFDPDVVIVMLGTNDAADVVPLDEYRVNMEHLIDQIHEKGAVAVLRTPNPLRSGDHRALALPDYAEVIRDIAAKKGAILVDHYADWSKELETRPYLWQNGYWNGDFVHPNANGQLNMAQGLIRDLGLWKKDSPICHLAYEMPPAPRA